MIGLAAGYDLAAFPLPLSANIEVGAGSDPRRSASLLFHTTNNAVVLELHRRGTRLRVTGSMSPRRRCPISESQARGCSLLWFIVAEER